MSVWLFTNTCYGNWLPGDPRGSVTSVRDFRPYEEAGKTRLVHNEYEEPVEPYRAALFRSARSRLKCAPIQLAAEHAVLILSQFQETCRFRGWLPHAVAIMENHFHLVIEVGESKPDKALGDLKAYASRRLNKEFGKPLSETWWTSGGSTRLLVDENAVIAAIRYVFERQPNPLVVWRVTPGADASGSR